MKKRTWSVYLPASYTTDSGFLMLAACIIDPDLSNLNIRELALLIKPYVWPTSSAYARIILL